MPPPVSPDALNSSPIVRYYSGAVTDRDLVAVAGNNCRSLRCNTAGDLTFTGADGVDVTVPFTAGETQTFQAKALKASGSTATGITVAW